jgi:hypothetical protein
MYCIDIHSFAGLTLFTTSLVAVLCDGAYVVNFNRIYGEHYIFHLFQCLFETTQDNAKHSKSLPFFPEFTFFSFENFPIHFPTRSLLVLLLLPGNGESLITHKNYFSFCAVYSGCSRCVFILCVHYSRLDNNVVVGAKRKS